MEKVLVWKAYIFSVIFPPAGLFYFVKYFFFIEEDNSKKTALTCLILAIISIYINIWMFKYLFSQPIQTDSQSSEFLEELITPENQQILKDLLK
ncbi:hypothetical protein A3D05_03085 [Candidatus Gottesmanbacteria bacterium RIFCSPHIGHO2_02_FULL_40_24]|uniref:Uncharacterized protein n=1 Tax=Candidatus Gottesmanbacteria bacterium RIFCSPHIGHO2_01_FULL_40_15 TaxID=1798376 RepID=A0A1F5Z662_9BACT|nr:MAG: hypothetical protein A2777_03280 [Candidatus Gottesmanbacteria bacterium RIFCSPHIGHO2_01_FULL_40_15]OGG16675.1 MAG: hypothetical protein A3D05_03085 [Candidatus Gottesmanbacteria bacterium RIFCSPHIGHO2_02_FULL_40_24]OGG25017.1 MAG: hypothetical protein A3E42_02570 [Candidatus Gottesmanbacteria bacterium RIFCSPHIGHO2_12_FULL_40_13]